MGSQASPSWNTVIRLANQAFTMQRCQGADFSNFEIEQCVFDNCLIRDSRVSQLQARNSRCWSCHINNVVLEDSSIEGLGGTPGGRGKWEPIFVWGARFKHVVLRGRVGGLMLMPPYDWHSRFKEPWPNEGLDEVRRYYGAVDWALDISDVAFTSVPTFRFGPPGHLIRRNPEHQVVVTRQAASSGRWKDLDIGVWRIGIEDLLHQRWPDDIVLAAATAGRRLDKELQGLALLRAAGIAE